MNCPNCAYKLKICDVKAECPKCGINIPNYNWEENLEKDALRSEAAFAKLKLRLAGFKFSLVGSPLQIVRLVCTFVPLVALVLPLAVISVNLPYLSDARQSVSVLNLILGIIKIPGIGDALPLISGEISSVYFLPLFIALVCIALGVVLAVLSFFILVINAFKFGWRGCFVCNIFSALLWTAAGFLFSSFTGGLAESTLSFLTSGSVGFGLFVGIGLFIMNAAINFYDGHILNKKRKAADAEMAVFNEKYKGIL